MKQSDEIKAANRTSSSPTGKPATGKPATPGTGARRTSTRAAPGTRKEATAGTRKTSTGGAGGTQKTTAAGGGEDQKSAITATARKQITETVDRKSTEIGEKVASAAETVRDVGKQLQDKPRVAKVTDGLAERVDGIAGYLTSSSPDQLVTDIRNLAAREPLLFAGACFAVGLFAARLVKAATHEGGGTSGTGSNGSSTPATTAGSSTGTGTRSRTASPSGRGS